jgi:peptide chain release factor 3
VEFKGVYDRLKKEVHLFERVPGGEYKAPVSVHDLSDPFVKGMLSEQTYREVIEELAMLDGAHGGFDTNAVLQGKTTPVFFGSAGNNFGVEFLLKGFLEYSSEPLPRKTKEGLIPLDHPHFSSLVFKVQTNMNPLHRDCVVFARVCSGRFYRDMKVYHARSGRDIRLSDSYNLFGRSREIMSEAYPGDIIGFVTKLDFRIGDTISTDPNIVFEEIPRFAPECFAYLQNAVASSYKPFRKGLEHLLAEDIVQTFSIQNSRQTTPLLGAVGPLQFEVLQYRLKDEYGAESRLEMMPWKILRWLEPTVEIKDLEQRLPQGASLALDDQKRWVVLFPTDWSFRYFPQNNASIKLLDTPPASGILTERKAR